METNIQTTIDQANQAYQQGNLQLAAEFFSRAADLYQEQGDELSAAEMRNNLSVALLRDGHYQAALEAAAQTDLVFAQGGDRRRQAIALSNQAAALDSLGDLGQALELYQISAGLFKELDEEEMLAMVLQNISTLQLRTGKQLQAVATMSSALEHKPKLSFREKIIQKLLRTSTKKMNG